MSGWAKAASSDVAETTRFIFCMIASGVLVNSAIIAAVSAG